MTLTYEAPTPDPDEGNDNTGDTPTQPGGDNQGTGGDVDEGDGGGAQIPPVDNGGGDIG